MERGFDTDRYLKAQRNEIIARIERFDRVYLEFGGKLLYDGHAARVLPGYRSKAKLELLKSLPKAEIIYCVNA